MFSRPWVLKLEHRNPTFQKCHAGRPSTCAIDDPNPRDQARTDQAARIEPILQRQAWDIRSPGKLSPGACQARDESHLCPLIGVLSRELFAPILPAAYLNSNDTRVASSGALGRCCCRHLRRRCASDNIVPIPTVGNNQRRWRPRPRPRSRPSKLTSRSMATPLADRKLDNPPPPPIATTRLATIADACGTDSVPLPSASVSPPFSTSSLLPATTSLAAPRRRFSDPSPSTSKPSSRRLAGRTREYGVWGAGRQLVGLLRTTCSTPCSMPSCRRQRLRESSFPAGGV